jgi:hypothetical protein
VQARVFVVNIVKVPVNRSAGVKMGDRGATAAAAAAAAPKPISKMTDAEVLKTIPPEFFKEFDAARYLLKEIPDVIDSEYVEHDLERRKRAQKLIESKLASKVMGNYAAFGLFGLVSCLFVH